MNQESHEIEVLPPSSLESITRGEIDIQIATAHRFPRSMQAFKRRALEMATLDEETAASCIYSRPVGGGKFAEGMSVRMAEIVGASYGNLRVGAMIISQTDRQVVVRGFAHDLESNFASTSEVVEATIKRDGKPYDERMRIVIAKSALAKARRDATFQVVPKALCKPVETEARRVAIGDATTIAKRRGAVVQWIEKLGIDKGRVWAALGIQGEDDIGIDQMTILTGLKTSIKDGDVTVDEAFPITTSTVQAAPVVKRATTQKPAETVAEKTEAAEHIAEGPAPDITAAKGVVIPDDATELLSLAKEVLGDVGIADADALRCLKTLKKAGAACKQLADVARSGLVWICEHPADVVAWVNANAAE